MDRFWMGWIGGLVDRPNINAATVDVDDLETTPNERTSEEYYTDSVMLSQEHGLLCRSAHACLRFIVRYHQSVRFNNDTVQCTLRRRRIDILELHLPHLHRFDSNLYSLHLLQSSIPNLSAML